MRDRRYSTAAWRRLRRFVIVRAGGICQVHGPRCTGIATTAHHKLPTSQYPELFFDPSNVEASCTPCNRHGAVTQAENRANRQTIAHLEAVIEEREAEIARLAAQLAGCEHGEAVEPERPRLSPRIY
jgi:5-methylcytosine-specific restriction endonuclease McrA